MPARQHPPTRTLPRHPDLAQLKRQAKELLKAFAAGDAAAIAEVQSHYRDASAAAFTLQHAQLVLARAYGFDSWPKIKAYIDGVTVGRLVEAVRAGDIESVTSLLSVRPELVHLDVSPDDEHQALHHAVLQRRPEIVRVLMRYGADARKGIYPYRAATSPITIATERGYTEIVEIIREAETRRRVSASESAVTSEPADTSPQRDEPERPVTTAVISNRPEILRALLASGVDPDERERVGGLDDVVYSWGNPLRECAIRGHVVMAEILLKHGANPNTNIYAGTCAMYEALARNDSQMVQLLERHGGIVDAITAALLGLTDRVQQLLEDERAGRLAEGVIWPGGKVASAVLEFSAERGHVDLVRMALEHLDWPPGDANWYGILRRPFGKHPDADRERHIACFRMILERSRADLPGPFGRTLLHDIAADWPRSAPMGAEEQLAFATVLIDNGARLDARDDLLKSTPLGWACRWGQIELVKLLLSRGADPIEADAESWATPRAWAEKMNHAHVRRALDAPKKK